MALQRHQPAYRALDQLVMEGKAQLVATPTINNFALATVIQPTQGQVAIITKIVCMCYGYKESSPDTQIQHSLFLYDASDTLTADGVNFIAFQRTDAVFASPSGPDWRSSQPNMPVIWEPEEPLIVPPRYSLKAVGSGDTQGGSNFACYGYLVDVDTARHLGFEVGKDAQTAGAVGVGGFGSALTVGFTSGVRGNTTSPVELVHPPVGYGLQIVDIYIRHQQLTFNPTQTAILFHGATVTDYLTSSNIIFTTANNNPSNFAEWKASPGIYLPVNRGLYFATAGTARASITVTYRLIKSEDIPKDHWWSYTGAFPTQGTTTGTSSLFTTGATGVTLNYPGRFGASDATATLPGNGKQHVVEGFMICAQKDATVNQDQAAFAIATGSSGGSVGLPSSGVGTINNLISPIFTLSGHDQLLAIAVDGLNVPCVKDTGFVLIDSTTTGYSATPVAADRDIDEFHCLIWGRTLPARFGTGHFQGSNA